MLCDCSWRSARELRAIHDTVNLSFLYHPVVIRAWASGTGIETAPSIPKAVNVVARDDLRQTSGHDMTYLNKPRVKEQNVGSVERSAFCGAFPLDNAATTARIAVFVDVQSEFCNKKRVLKRYDEIDDMANTHHHSKGEIRLRWTGTCLMDDMTRSVSRSR